MRTTRLSGALLLALLAAIGWPAATHAQTFRWVTSALPDGTTNAVYTARLFTANANGDVTYSVAPSMPPGLALDAATGIITGRPTSASNFGVTFSATDASTTIDLPITLKISASGGGGNEGLSFVTTSLPDGRVGVDYAVLIEVQSGVGPFVFAADNLPTGLTLDGLSGQISGKPTAAGTYYVTLSGTDHGENENKVFTILPLLVLPALSDFKFMTTLLDNGEVGTPYSHTVHTTGAFSTVVYSAAGLAAGLAIHPVTGEIAGTPTSSGTFFVTIGATDGAYSIIANLFLWIVPSSTSGFYWDFFGFPVALQGVEYSRQPPIALAAVGGTSVSYAAAGLPLGIAYDGVSGEISGIATEIGPYFVTFTATDTKGDLDPSNDEVIVLGADFFVLPPYGGSTNDLPSNFWVKKQTLRSGVPGKDSWKATYIYNADRRTGNAFDPAVHSFLVSLGARTIALDPGTLIAGTSGKFTFASPRGEIPAVKVTIQPVTQTIAVATKADTINDSVPAVLRNPMTLGAKGYRLDEFLDAKGKFRVTSGYRKIAFVCDKAKVKIKGPGTDAVSFGLLLGDPGFLYESGVSELRFQIRSGGATVLDKTFTALVTATQKVDATGAVIFKLKSVKDLATTDTLKKFSYESGKGKMTFALANTTLALPPGEAHVTLDLKVAAKIYLTSVTLFEGNTGSYSTKP